MVRVSVYQKKILGILATITICFILCCVADQYLITKGTFEPCERIRIGDSLFYLRVFGGVKLSDSTYEYYMRSPCETDIIYSFEFSTNFVLPRVSKIIIGYSGYSSISVINSALKTLGFDEMIDNKEAGMSFLNRSENVIFSVSRYDLTPNYRPVYFTILK